MLRLCAAPYCPVLVEKPARYCQTHHTPAQSGTPGYGGAWRRIRDAYIAAHPKCERCPDPAKPALDVHHRDGRHPSEPGANDWSNLEALCRSCHRRATEHDSRPTSRSTRRDSRRRTQGGVEITRMKR